MFCCITSIFSLHMSNRRRCILLSYADYVRSPHIAAESLGSLSYPSAAHFLKIFRTLHSLFLYALPFGMLGSKLNCTFHIRRCSHSRWSWIPRKCSDNWWCSNHDTWHYPPAWAHPDRRSSESLSSQALTVDLECWAVGCSRGFMGTSRDTVRSPTSRFSSNRWCISCRTYDCNWAV